MRWLLSNYIPAVVLLKNCSTNPQFGSMNYIGISGCSEQSLRGRQLLSWLATLPLIWSGSPNRFKQLTAQQATWASWSDWFPFPPKPCGANVCLCHSWETLNPYPPTPASLTRGLLTNQPKRKTLSFYLSGNRPAFWLGGRHFLPSFQGCLQMSLKRCLCYLFQGVYRHQ